MKRYEIVTRSVRGDSHSVGGTYLGESRADYVTVNNDDELRKAISKITSNWRSFDKCYEISSDNSDFKKEYDPYKTRNEQGYIIDVESMVKQAMGDEFEDIKVPYGHAKRVWEHYQDNGELLYRFEMNDTNSNDYSDTYYIPQSAFESLERLTAYIRQIREYRIHFEIEKHKKDIELLQNKLSSLESQE